MYFARLFSPRDGPSPADIKVAVARWSGIASALMVRENSYLIARASA